MKNKYQILYIHGGMTFKNKSDYLFYLKNKEVSIEKKSRWSGEYLENSLGKQFNIIRPRMPLSENAKYEEWKIVFEKYLPQLGENLILIGASLGGIFLAKYLSENKFPQKTISTYLVCPPFDGTHSIPGEDLVGGFRLKSDLSMLDNSSENLYLLFSADDEVVPQYHAEKYKKKLKKAVIKIYKNKNGHFKVKTFPEIVKMIRQDIKKS